MMVARSLQARIVVLAASTFVAVAFSAFASPPPAPAYAPTVVTESADLPETLIVAAATIVTIDGKPTYIQVYLLNIGNNRTGAIYIDPAKSTVEVGSLRANAAFTLATDTTKDLPIKRPVILIGGYAVLRVLPSSNVQTGSIADHFSGTSWSPLPMPDGTIHLRIVYTTSSTQPGAPLSYVDLTLAPWSASGS